MADFFWRGTLDNDITKKENYVTSAGATPASDPANGDKLIFNKGNVDVDGGASSLTNMDIVATTGYTGRFGASSAVGIGINTIRWDGGGSVNIDGDITDGKIRCAPGRFFNYEGGTATDLLVVSTPYTIKGVVTNGKSIGGARGSDTNNATGYTSFVIEGGGQHVTRRSGVFEVAGRSMLTVERQGSLASSSATVVHNGSMMYYNSPADITGEVEVRPRARFDASSSPGFGFGSGTLTRYQSSFINLFTADGEVTPGTENVTGLSEQQSIGQPGQQA